MQYLMVMQEELKSFGFHFVNVNLGEVEIMNKSQSMATRPAQRSFIKIWT